MTFILYIIKPDSYHDIIPNFALKSYHRMKHANAKWFILIFVLK